MTSDKQHGVRCSLFLVAGCMLFSCFLLLVSCRLALAETTEARVAEFTQDISDNAYYDRILALVFDAHQSIDVALGELHSTDQAPMERLLEALSKKSSHTIKVRLFVSGKSVDHLDELQGLLKAGASLKLIDPTVSFKDQLFIFDQKIVVEGGPSWMEKVAQGLGSATAVYSENLAQQKTKRLENLPLADSASSKIVFSKSDCVVIPTAVMENEKFFPAMIKQNEPDLMKLYLFLCFRQFQKDQDGWVEKLSEIPLPRGEGKGEGENIEKMLIRLSQTYGLIRFKKMTEQEVAIGLVDLAERQTVWIPRAFFEKQMDAHLSSAALFDYLILLKEAKNAPERPFEMAPIVQLAEDFPVAVNQIEEGMKELRSLGLLEIFPPQDGDLEKLPRYDLGPILSDQEKRAQWVSLMAQAEKSKIETAKKLAQKLQNEAPLVLVKQFMELLNQFPQSDVEEVTDQVARLDQLSPYRTPQRVQAILEAMKSGQSSVSLVPEG